jgi:hypothetical protein
VPFTVTDVVPVAAIVDVDRDVEAVPVPRFSAGGAGATGRRRSEPPRRGRRRALR